MASKETVYEAIVALRAESTQLRTDLSKSSAMLESSLTSMGSMAQRLAPILTIGGIIAFGKSVIDTAGQVTDLAAQTGFFAQTLSGIKSTLEENGTSLDTFARGVFMAQKNLGGIDDESDKAALALGRLGLNVDTLKNATPEDFLKLVGTAMEGVVNPTERASIGAAIFGKSWQEIGPILGEVATNLDKLRASGMSEEDIKKLDAFGDSITRLGNAAMIISSRPLADLADAVDRLFNSTSGARLTNDLVAVNYELDQIDKTLAKRKDPSRVNDPRALSPLYAVEFGATDALIARKEALLAINKELSAQGTADAAKKTAGGDAANAIAAAGALKTQTQATTDLSNVTKELDQAGMSPLRKSLDDIIAKFLVFRKNSLAAYKGDELVAYNNKLDVQQGKIERNAKMLAANAQIDTGAGAVAKFETQFDVKFDSTKKSAALEMVQNFVAVANAKLKDPAAQATLQAGFRSLVEQSIKEGVPDIPELLRSAGLTDLSGLTFALGPELLKGFQASEQEGEQWGATMKAETTAAQESFGQIGKAVGDIKKDMDALRAAAAESLIVQMDTAMAEAGLTRVQVQLEIMKGQILNMPKVAVVQ